jgi:hypothetical protein
MAAALAQPRLDPQVAQMVRDLRPTCTKDGVNYCADDAVELYATGGAGVPEAREAGVIRQQMREAMGL